MRPSAHSEPGGEGVSPPGASANGTYWPSRMLWSKPHVCRRCGTVNYVCVSIGGGSRSPRPPADVGINHRKQDVHSPHWCASPRVAERNPLRDLSYGVYVSYSLHVVVAGRYFAVDVFSVSLNLPVDRYNAYPDERFCTRL